MRAFMSALSLVILLVAGFIIPSQTQSHPIDPQLIQTDQSVHETLSSTNLMNQTCSNLERAWGEWCVYTYTDDNPDPVIHGFENIYHASAWRENNRWNVVVGGWKNGESQGWHDAVYKLSTTDPYGLTGYTQVGTTPLINNTWETTSSADCPPANAYIVPTATPRPCPVSGTVVKSFHTVQPDMFSMKWTRPRPAGIDCCDTLFYAYDIEGLRHPEQNVGVHYAWFDTAGTLYRGGIYGDKNPILDWHIGSTVHRSVVSTSDARVTYDPATQKFYMVYSDYGYNNGHPVATAHLSIAQSGWTNLRFHSPTTQVVPWVNQSNVNGQLVVTGSGPYEYYLFFTIYRNEQVSEIWMAKSSGGITGPYEQHNARMVLKNPNLPVNPPTATPVTLTPTPNATPTPSRLYGVVGTPYVFCNTALNPPQWQMYFNGSDSIVGHKVFTAFLHKTCEYDANNPTQPPSSAPVLP